jgi:hypothetical protein
MIRERVEELHRADRLHRDHRGVRRLEDDDLAGVGVAQPPPQAQPRGLGSVGGRGSGGSHGTSLARIRSRGHGTPVIGRDQVDEGSGRFDPRPGEHHDVVPAHGQVVAEAPAERAGTTGDDDLHPRNVRRVRVSRSR